MTRTADQKKEWAKDKVAEVGNQIVDQFQSGNLPESLAPIFLNCGERNADRWKGWTNRLLVALSGNTDAGTYEQWLERGRQVKTGEHKSVYLFRPMMLKSKKTDKNGEEKEHSFIRFTVFGVFGIEQTEIIDAEKWAKYAPDQEAINAHISSLPLIEVAKEWGIKIGAYSGKVGQALGSYSPSKHVINLGVTDIMTWAHEMIHAADDRNGKIKHCSYGSPEYSYGEIVAELGACILLTILGYDRGSDRGGAFKYVSAWSNGKDVVASCRKMLDRTCDAVALILKTAANLRDGIDTLDGEIKEEIAVMA